MRDHGREKGSEPCFLYHISVIWGNAPLTLLASHWDGDSHLGPLGMLTEALCDTSGHLEDWNTSLSLFRIALPHSLCLLGALQLDYVRLWRCSLPTTIKYFTTYICLCSFALFGKCTRLSYNFHFKKQQSCKEIWEIAGQWQWYFKVQNLCDRHFVGVARYTLAELPACGDQKQENEEHVGLA